MATVTASAVETTDSLETFRQRFNTLRSDIQGLSFGGSLVFEGTTADDFETTLVITDPTADRTVTIQNKTGVLAMQGRDINDVVVMDASDGSGTDESGAILLNASASGVDEGEALLYEEGTGDHIVNPVLQIGGNFVFEGATDNEFETTLSITDPTADRTVTIQDKTGTVALQGRDIDDIIVLNGTDASGTDEASAIILDGDATSVAGVVVNVGEALLYEEGVNDHILNPTFEGVEEFIILEESLEGTPSFALKENVDSSSLDARFAYQPATSDNLLGSLFIPPSAGGVQFTMPVSDGDNNQVLATDGSGNLSFKNQSSGMSLGNDANNRVVTATGSGSGNGEANLTFDGSTLVITGAVDMSGAFDTDGVASAATFEPDGDTSAGDNAAIGYTSAEGLILTGQGSTNDVTIKNDADQDVIEIPTGTQNVTFAGNIVIADAGNIGSASDTDAISIGSDGDVTLTQDLELQHDGAILSFGADDDVTATHVADVGINFASTRSGADSIFRLQNLANASASDVRLIIQTGGTSGGDPLINLDGQATGAKFSVGVDTSGDKFVIADADKGGFDGSDEMLTIDNDGAVTLFHSSNAKVATTSTGIQITSTTYAPISRRGEDVFIVFDQTAAGGTDAGDNVIMNASDGSSTDDGDDIIGEDEVFLHSGMQRNVLQIFNSGGRLLNSVAGFAPGAI